MDDSKAIVIKEEDLLKLDEVVDTEEFEVCGKGDDEE